MQNAKIKFQLATGFGVAVFQNEVELTFVDKINSYKKGEAIFATPYYLKKKLVCDVFSPTEKYDAQIACNYYTNHGKVRFNIGEYKAVNGYPVFEKTMVLELKDCEVISVQLESVPNENYGKEGCRSITANLRHRPTGFLFNAWLFYSADFYNKKHSLNKETITSFINTEKKIIQENYSFQAERIEYAKDFIPIWENLAETLVEDFNSNMIALAKATIELHSKKYSPNYTQKNVLEQHLKREFFKDELGIKI